MKRFILAQTVLVLSVILISPAYSQTSDVLVKAYDFIKTEFGLDRQAIGDLKIKDLYVSDHNQVQHMHLVQTFKGLEIFGTSINLAILPNGIISGKSHRLTIIDEVNGNDNRPGITAPGAISIVANSLGITSRAVPEITRMTAAGIPVYSKNDISLQDIPVELGYIFTNGQYRLAWKMHIEAKKNGNLYQSFVDAHNGTAIANDVLTLHCSFEDGYLSSEDDCHTHALPSPKSEAPPSGAVGQYRVLPLTIESPGHGSFDLVSGVEDPIASPFGWHDTNGAAGHEYSITRGNNVYAFIDRDWDYATDGDVDGGAGLNFDFPFNPDMEPEGNQNIALTNLFFWNNVMHDFAFRYGFNEVAGNFQQRNYSSSGNADDYVEAHAQFGDDNTPLCGTQANGGTECLNNADFSTPIDGFNGRMRMFTWDNDNGNKLLDVLEPLEFAGKIVTGAAQFGPEIDDNPVIAQVVVADDGSTNPSHACGDFNAQSGVDGKIVIIDRGLCDFSEKVYNVQQGGALGAIICNFDETVIGMAAGVDATLVTIPSVFISNGDCARIRVAASNGLVVSLVAPAATGGPVKRDGSLDVSVVAHEYGHGISTRLTGGPSASGCLSPSIITGAGEEPWGMGEGWSDFFALVNTVKSGDSGAKKRGIGTYVNKEGNDGRGIRSYPYSTDMAINSHTYDDILFESIPHGVGSVWAVMLWDLYWAFSDEYGWDPDVFGGTGGNNMAIQLVMDGLKLQGCGPGFIDARNAILQADQINNNGVNECLIWEVFARRGLGWNAEGGEPASRADGIEGFETLPTCVKELKLSKTMTSEIVAGEQIQVTLHAINHTGTQLTNIFLEEPVPAGTSYVTGSGNIEPVNGNTLVWNFDVMDPGEEINITYLLQSDPQNNSVRLDYDDMEGDPFARWEIYWDVNGSADNFWFPQDLIVNSGTSAWYVADVPVESEHYLQNLTPYLVSGNYPVYRFYHYYSTEAGADGGFLEISTDGGSIWNTLEEEIFRNGYPRRLQYTTFAIPNLFAFSGLSHPELKMTPVYLDLSDYIGEEVKIRYRFGTDENTAGDGWFIDDIEIMDAVIYNSEACISSDQTGSVCAEAPERGTIVDSQITIGTEDGHDNTAVTLRPNPAGDFIEIVLSSAKSEDAVLSVFDLTGRMVYTSPWNLSEGINQHVIHLGKFNAGMYVAQVNSGEITFSKKFIKE